MEILVVAVIILALWNFILTISSLNINDKATDAYSAGKDSPRKYEFERLERDLEYVEEDHSRDLDRAKRAIAKICEYLNIRLTLMSQPEEVIELTELPQYDNEEKEEQEDN